MKSEPETSFPLAEILGAIFHGASERPTTDILKDLQNEKLYDVVVVRRRGKRKRETIEPQKRRSAARIAAARKRKKKIRPIKKSRIE